jgi:hypothetical protein
MPNGDSITGAAWYHELQIIPFSTDTSKYFLFSYGSDNPNNQGLYYSIIDMSLANGNGSIIEKNIQINPNRIADCLTSVKHGNGRDWWLIAKLADGSLSTSNNRFLIYPIINDSIYPVIIQDFNDALDADFQKIIWRPDYNRFMLINTVGYMSEFAFDRCSGNITLIRSIFPEQSSNFNRLFWEGAYSPNGNLFYVTTEFWLGVDSCYLLQYDLTTTNIPASADTLDATVVPIATGAVRLGPDNRIYFTRWYLCNSPPYCYPYPDSVRNIYNENLSVINSPDSLGSACDYQPFGFYLGGKRTYAGLPNNPKYDLGALTGSVCDSLTSGIAAVEKKPMNGYIYPNPSSANVTYKCTLKEGNHGIITISNTIGEILIHKKINSTATLIETGLLPSGIYFYRVVADGKVLDKGKIIIDR